jgi:hypothetical protein
MPFSSIILKPSEEYHLALWNNYMMSVFVGSFLLEGV